jgi:hypothetical protein
LVGTLNAPLIKRGWKLGLFTDAAVVFAAKVHYIFTPSLFPIFPFSSFFFVVFAFSFRRRLVLKERGSQERTIHTFPAGFLFLFFFFCIPISPYPLIATVQQTQQETVWFGY